MKGGRRIGILGGTFDPIHRGHVDLGTAAEIALGLSTVLVVPANLPPHRSQPQASAFHRFAMVALTVADRPGWRACDLELQRGSHSYTYATLQELHALGYDPLELFFLLGADAFVDIESWRDYPKILGSAHFAVVSRPGFHVNDLSARLPALAPFMVPAGRVKKDPSTSPVIILIDAPTADVSSTEIRRRRSQGRPLDDLVLAGVEQHIERHGLYRASSARSEEQRQLTPPTADRLHGQS
jgi:nicotinate-nucleotide adenylyltransferase